MLIYNQPSRNLHGLSNPPACASNEPPQALSRLDRIKRQLLGTNDWAAIGVTRPVKMPFRSIEELERFGKRRKLTEADHNRLVPSGGRISHPRPRQGPRERASSEFGMIGKVDIRIHRPWDSPESSSNGRNKNSNESSQPMLLDREDSDLVDRSLSTDGGAYSPSKGRTISSQLLLSSQNLPRKSPSLAPSDIVLPIESVSQEQEQQYANLFGPHPYPQPSRSLMRLDSYTPSLHQPVPQFPRRFTIDDQIAAELEAQPSREMRDKAQLQLSDAGDSYAASECSSKRMHDEYGLSAAAGTQFISSNQFSGWLPEPKHHVQRFVGQEDPSANTSHTVTVSETVDRGQPTYDAELGLRMNASGSYTSPIKIFDHSVGLNETMEDIQNSQQPVYNTNPRFNPPQSYMTPSPQHARPQEEFDPERYMLNGSIKRAMNQAFNDRPRKDFEPYRNTLFTPFRQRISRQPDVNNLNFVNDVVEQQTVYEQYLSTSTSSKQEATDSRQRFIATSSPNLLSTERTYRKPF